MIENELQVMEEYIFYSIKVSMNMDINEGGIKGKDVRVVDY